MAIPSFRAWNVEYKEMKYSDDMSMETFFATNDASYDNVIFMQYTGLKDKKGKKIYEGDILRHYEMNLSIYVDSFHGYRFMWGLDLLVKANAINGEVIGNIYENPELLNGG